MMLDPTNPFADLVPSDTPGVINGPAKVDDPLDREAKELDIRKKRIDLGLDPPIGSTATASDLNGDAYLSTLDKPTAALVRALAEGRKSFPSGAALRSPYWQNILTHVSNYDPGFDETNYTTRNATRRDFSIGTAGKNIRALNTAIGHLGQLYDQVGGTASHGFVPLNVAENAGRKMFGDSGPTTYAATTSALAGELTAVYRGSGGAEADIKRYIDELSPNASEAQKRGTIANIAGLLNSRLQALQDQYTKGMGVGAKDYQFLDPHAQQVLGNLGVEGFAPSKPGNDTPPPAPAIPPATPPNGDEGGEAPKGAIELTDDQKTAYAAFWKANPNPSPDQLKTFLGGIGVNNVQNAEEIIKAAKAGRGYSTTDIQTDYQTRLKQRIKRENELGAGEGPVEALGAQGRTFNLSDEAAGVGNALANAVVAPFSSRVDFDPVNAYTFGRDVERQRIDDARQQLGYGGTAVEIASSFGTGNPAGALDAVAPRAAAAVGALAGFGSGEGATDSAMQATAGALGGYAVGRYAEPALRAAGRGVSKVIPNSLKTRLLPPQGMAPDLAAAADAEGVDLIRPMVDPASRAKYGALESTPASQGTIRGGFNRVLGQIEDRVKGLGGGTAFGEADQAGQAAQEGGKNWLQSRTVQKNRLYRQAEEKAAGARFVPEQAISEADAQIAELSGNPNANAAEIAFLQGYRDDLAAEGGKSVAEIRNLREGLNASIRRNSLTMDGAGVRALRVLNAAKADIAKAAPDAANAYNRADQYYAASQPIVDDLEASILGTRDKPIEPQVALKNLRAMMSDTGTGRRYARIMQSLDSNTRQDIAATWAQALGRDAPDAPFQLGKFLGQTKGLSPSALRTAFGPEGAESVKNLRTLSQALKDAGGDVNYARSGSVIAALARRFLTGVTGLGTVGAVTTHSVSGAGIGAAAGLAAAGAGDVRNILSARAMVNPRVSRWLADVANVNNRSQAHAALRKLSVVISREPALASELTPLYARISRALSQPMEMPLAAQPQTEGDQNDQQ